MVVYGRLSAGRRGGETRPVQRREGREVTGAKVCGKSCGESHSLHRAHLQRRKEEVVKPQKKKGVLAAERPSEELLLASLSRALRPHVGGTFRGVLPLKGQARRTEGRAIVALHSAPPHRAVNTSMIENRTADCQPR